MKRRGKPVVPPSSTVNAAALQQHFARGLSLGGPPRPKRKARVTEKEYVDSLDLAERLGLVQPPPKPPAPLTDEEWGDARQKALERDDHQYPCPICYEEFGVSPQVILSCSHVFHRACLKSFEKFASESVCPLCRQKDYEKKIISDGERVHRDKCVIRIQALVRGFLVRCRYEHAIMEIVPRDPERRKNFFAKRLHGMSRRLVQHMDDTHVDVDAILAESDSVLMASRQVRCDLDTMARRDNVRLPIRIEWAEVAKKAEDRGWDCEACPICIAPLKKEGKPMSILSCSHVFHTTCVTSFENYAAGSALVCPVCRSKYERAKWPVENVNSL